MGPIDVGLWEKRERNPEAIRAEFQGDKGRGWLMRWLPARAHDNGMFLVFANGVGQDDDEVRTGNAMVIDCYGRIMAESRADRETIWLSLISMLLRERSTGVRWIKARRPELYGRCQSARVARWIREPCDSSTMAPSANACGQASSCLPRLLNRNYFWRRRDASCPLPRRTMFDLANVKRPFASFGFDGWLIYDFRGSNLLARRVVGFAERPDGLAAMVLLRAGRWRAAKLVHRIESGVLDHLPGEKTVYLRWQELEAGVAKLVAGRSARGDGVFAAERQSVCLACRCGNGRAGAELRRGGRLVRRPDPAVRGDVGRRADRDALRGRTPHRRGIRQSLGVHRRKGARRGWRDVKSKCSALIMRHFQENGLTTYHPPIVGANAHSGDPHFDTSPATNAPIREGDFVLIDLWAKMDRPRSVYSDLTRVGYRGSFRAGEVRTHFQDCCRSSRCGDRMR